MPDMSQFENLNGSLGISLGKTYQVDLILESFAKRHAPQLCCGYTLSPKIQLSLNILKVPWPFGVRRGFRLIEHFVLIY